MAARLHPWRTRLEPSDADVSAFPITQRWLAQHPDRLQLYSLKTPNGVTVSVMLEDIGLPYEAHRVDIGKKAAPKTARLRRI